MNNCVIIHEVGPRDGLQNEPGIIPVADKIALITALADAGIKQLEVGAFVSPKWVPQMADTDAVTAQLPALTNGQYDVLVPNMRGWESFLAATKHGSFGIAVFISASEGFSQANLNCSVAQSVERVVPVVAAAKAQGVPVRGYVSCVTDCPFDGPVAPHAVASAVASLRALGDMQISLGDTIGKGTPQTVDVMLDAVLDVVTANDLAGHFHDTSGQALANVAVSLERGLRAFDGAAGGLGGCPYAPGAPGNLATESLVAFLHGQGLETGIDVAALDDAADLARKIRRTARESD